jgi:hypothetical protein
MTSSRLYNGYGGDVMNKKMKLLLVFTIILVIYYFPIRFKVNSSIERFEIFALSSIVNEHGETNLISEDFRYNFNTNEFKEIKALLDESHYHRCLSTLYQPDEYQLNGYIITIYMNDHFYQIRDNLLTIGETRYCVDYRLYGNSNLYNEILKVIKK